LTLALRPPELGINWSNPDSAWTGLRHPTININLVLSADTVAWWGGDDMKTERSLVWRRSTRCSSNACVEVAMSEQAVFVRSSVHPEALNLSFSRECWREFVAALRAGEFDYSAAEDAYRRSDD
jgi:hypothetical protein